MLGTKRPRLILAWLLTWQPHSPQPSPSSENEKISAGYSVGALSAEAQKPDWHRSGADGDSERNQRADRRGDEFGLGC